MPGVAAVAACCLGVVVVDAGDVAIPAEIKPLLAEHCVDCHEGARAKGGLDLARALDAGAGSESMLRALRHRLARRDMPPATEAVRPDIDAYRRAVAAIDAVCAPTAREVPAVRRLNRAQYAGAVRDVLGFDADGVRELLPRDEIGEGFDTTAATLALPPLLVEKYFDAAERIAASCVPPASWSQKRVFPAEKLERKGQGGTYDGVAWLATVGAMSASTEVTHAGRYRVSVEACGQFAGREDPIVQVVVDGRVVVAAGVHEPAGATQEVHAEVELSQGAHAIAARFPNDFWDPDNADPKRRDRNLGVARIVLEGPLGATADTAFELRAAAVAGEGDARTRLCRVAAAVGEELFRRPLSADECEALASTAASAAGSAAEFDAQLRELVTAMLVDPRFLLRVESVPAAGARTPLGAYELASRMACFLWSSVPDAELRRAAAAGELAQESALRAQVRRMLADARAVSLSQRFATQWLGVDGLEARQLDPTLFPDVDARLLASMRCETERLFDEVVRGVKPVRALIESRTTHVDARLAAHYGMPAPAEGAWEERAIADARGRGVLGHASVLVATSNPTRTSPVKRGKWVLQSLLDDAPPPPPPGVPQLPEGAGSAKSLSMRELMAAHRSNPDCAACHVKMDAIGLAFESGAADGRLRPMPSEASELPDGSVLRGVRGVEELAAKGRAFERSLARQLLVYALGRGTADADDPLVDALAERLSERGEFAALAEGILISDAFRTRVAR